MGCGLEVLGLFGFRLRVGFEGVLGVGEIVRISLRSRNKI